MDRFRAATYLRGTHQFALLTNLANKADLHQHVLNRKQERWDSHFIETSPEGLLPYKPERRGPRARSGSGLDLGSTNLLLICKCRVNLRLRVILGCVIVVNAVSGESASASI